MDETLQPTLDAIAGWTTSPSQLAFDVRFGHIRGPAATAKGIRIPLRISLQMPDVAVIHVVPNFKKAPVIQGREREPMLKGQDSPVHTHTYVEMIILLQRARHATIIIIDADPDFSADFSLALAATTTFAISAASDTGAKMRVLTLSWEKIHPMTKKLFGRGGVPQEFLVSDPGRTIPKLVEHEDGLMVLDRVADQLDPEGRHHALCFQGLPEMGVWDSFTLSMDNFDAVKHHSGDPKRSIVYIETGLRVPEMFQGADFIHLITSDTAWKKIFDLQTRQVLGVAVKLSASERKQQETWARRTDCANCYIYASATFLSGDNKRRPRRMDILNAQADGFIAGLTEFAHWPSSFKYLMESIRPMDTGHVLLDMQERLILRGLIKHDGNNMLGLSLALPRSMHQTFYAFLPLVGYDSRIAQFLCLDSSADLVNTAKIQVAVVLTANARSMFDLKPGGMGLEDRQTFSLNVCSGLLRDLSLYGTSFATLGLMKSYKADPNIHLRGAVQHEVRRNWLWMNIPVVRKAWKMYSDFVNAWDNCGNAATQLRIDIHGDEGRYLSAAEADEVYLHLAQAFTGQMVRVTFHQNWQPNMEDVSSGRTVWCPEFTAFAVDWRTIRAIDGDCCLGFYTTGTRTGEVIEIDDWNWIPYRIWSQCQEQWGAVGPRLCDTPQPLHPNKDEA
ncbi:hypothetical protein FDECE_13961 [Fusarium decemcellulare]|nr:hypothetical protein FDECE_13961 [Fusarium decemcellulare]